MNRITVNTLSKIAASSIFTFSGLLCCGCFDGNADVESAVYRTLGGSMECSCSHCKKKGIGLDAWNMPMYERHPITYERHPITKVSSKKGLVKDVWVVTINWECDKCSPYYKDGKKKRKKCEYSYINKKLRWIRDVDEKK